jgi:hypothetical protein
VSYSSERSATARHRSVARKLGCVRFGPLLLLVGA